MHYAVFHLTARRK